MTPALDELRRYCSEDVLALNQDIFASAASAQPRKSKYGNRKVILDGMTFDSGKEASRYVQLREMAVRQEIATLSRQVKYTLQEATVDSEGKRQRAITYSADFVYEQDGKVVIEDVKSVATAKSESFRLRWRMLLAKFRGDPHVICRIHI